MSRLDLDDRKRVANIRMRTNAALSALHEQGIPDEARVAFLQTQLYGVLAEARDLDPFTSSLGSVEAS